MLKVIVHKSKQASTSSAVSGDPLDLQDILQTSARDGMVAGIVAAELKLVLVYAAVVAIALEAYSETTGCVGRRTYRCTSESTA